jgi:hypothetical protein
LGHYIKCATGRAYDRITREVVEARLARLTDALCATCEFDGRADGDLAISCLRPPPCAGGAL